MRIESEAPEFREAVLALNSMAFGGDEEAGIIARLDRNGLVLLSLVAIEEGAVIGHILFSRLDVTVEGAAINAAALAPMAVLPGHQRRGIGGALVLAGIAGMSQQRIEAIIVLGHTEFYPRFGFRHDLVRNIASPFTAHDAFMGLELSPGVLAGKAGICTYPQAFGI